MLAHAYTQRLKGSCALIEFRSMIYRRKLVYIRDVLNLFLREKIHYSFKYDGTNVGVGDDLRLRGRKTLILPDAETYQRVSLDHAKACLEKTRVVKQKLMLEDQLQLIVHGELMCNPNKFDYTKRDLVAKFFAFGATIHSIEVGFWCFGYLLLRCTQSQPQTFNLLSVNLQICDIQCTECTTGPSSKRPCSQRLQRVQVGCVSSDHDVSCEL